MITNCSKTSSQTIRYIFSFVFIESVNRGVPKNCKKKSDSYILTVKP